MRLSMASVCGCVAVVSVAAGSLALAASASAAQREPVDVASGEGSGPTRDVLRERIATLGGLEHGSSADAAALASLPRVGDRRRVRLFDDVVMTIEVTTAMARPDGFVWHGRLLDEDAGTCTVTMQSGVLSAGFWSSRGSFGIVPDHEQANSRETGSEGAYRVQRLSPEATKRCLMSEGVPGVPPGFEIPVAGDVTRASAPAPESRIQRESGQRSSNPAPADRSDEPTRARDDASPATRTCDCPDDQSAVDVLCVYTTLAKNAAGGLPAVKARVQNAVDATNGAFINSGISTSGADRLQIRLTGYAEIAYDEQSPQWLDHLIRVTETADGFMDQVHALRDQHKADAVLLVVDDVRFTGGAAWWAIWDQGLAFSTCNWRGLGGGSLLLAHELGHNFGCAHDRGNDTSAPRSYAWGHTITAAGTTYRTIMAYPGTVELQVYSNPHLTHAATGKPMGVPVGQPQAAHNAYVIRQTRWTLANHRDAAGIVDCNGNGVDDSTDIAAGSSVDANGNCRPDECEERRYVDAQTPGPGEGLAWSGAGGDLTEILDTASLRCSNIKQVWVADGEYTPDFGTADRWRSFPLTSGLALHGGFQGKSRPGGGETDLSQRVAGEFESVLTGEIGSTSESDNSYSVVTGFGVDPHSKVDRFTITRGYSDFWGAGAYLEAASATFLDCSFLDNRAGGGGGAAIWSGGEPEFINCDFLNNSAVGAGGGGLSGNDGASPRIDRSRFFGNRGRWGGAVAVADSTLDLRSSDLRDNVATEFNGGAADIHNCTTLLANSILTGNRAQSEGGAVWIAGGSQADLVNCTVADNSATGWNGGVTVYFAHADIGNTILWGNTAAATDPQDRQVVYFGATGGLSRSRVEGWTGSLGGDANTGDEPYFTDTAIGDYSLSAGSSCVDAGDASRLPTEIVFDAGGNPRRVDDPASMDSGVGEPPMIDIGALERQPCPTDFDGSGFVDTDDFTAFVVAFELGVDEADFDGTGFVDTDDFTAFVLAFESGC